MEHKFLHIFCVRDKLLGIHWLSMHNLSSDGSTIVYMGALLQQANKSNNKNKLERVVTMPLNNSALTLTYWCQINCYGNSETDGRHKGIECLANMILLTCLHLSAQCSQTFLNFDQNCSAQLALIKHDVTKYLRKSFKSIFLLFLFLINQVHKLKNHWLEREILVNRKPTQILPPLSLWQGNGGKERNQGFYPFKET